MIRKVILVIAIAFLTEILTACFLSPTYENCGDSKLRIFRYVGLTPDNVKTSSGRPYPVKESISSTVYGIRLLLNLETIAAHKSIMPSWLNAAYAQCNNETLKPHDTISSIKIITKDRFDNSHDAGTDKSDYFYYYENSTPIETLLSTDMDNQEWYSLTRGYDFASNKRTIDLHQSFIFARYDI